MNWTKFWDAVGSFFNDIGSVFLAGIKAAIPIAEQAAINFIAALVDQVITDIETGVIPLPFTASEDKLALGNTKRNIAFNEIKKKLETVVIPEGMVIKDSIIYWQIETSVQWYKSGNHGNFPGGNSGPVPEDK